MIVDVVDQDPCQTLGLHSPIFTCFAPAPCQELPACPLARTNQARVEFPDSAGAIESGQNSRLARGTPLLVQTLPLGASPTGACSFPGFFDLGNFHLFSQFSPCFFSSAGQLPFPSVATTKKAFQGLDILATKDGWYVSPA